MAAATACHGQPRERLHVETPCAGREGRAKAFAEWWYRLSDTGVARELWLHNGGHGGPRGGADPAAYKLTENRRHWLFGVDNGVMSEPRVPIERADDQYDYASDWPAPGAHLERLRLSASSPTAPGTLTQVGGAGTEQSFVDRGRELDTDDVLIQNPDAANPNRLVYRTAPLSADTRMSGTPWVDLRMPVDNRNAANLTAVLVDYGPRAPVMVTRGWLDPQNRTAIDRSQPIAQGQLYRFTWDLQPDDYIWQAGHRIGLVVVSTDHDYTIRPDPGTELTLDPAGSDVRLPLAGGF